MTQLQLYLYLVAGVCLISCIDNKQKSSALDKNTDHCLINKHMWKCQGHKTGITDKILPKDADTAGKYSQLYLNNIILHS